jgi:hypothetical protein
VKRNTAGWIIFVWVTSAIVCCAQVNLVSPQLRSKTVDGNVMLVDVRAHFVTAIRLPEPVNSIAVGDTSLFQVEHSEREPELVLIKALTERNAETNLLITSTHGRQFSLLLIGHGADASSPRVDFLLQYKPAVSFLIEPEVVPFPSVGQTSTLAIAESELKNTQAPTSVPLLFTPAASLTKSNIEVDAIQQRLPAPSLDDLLARQETAALPPLYGERVETESAKGDRLQVGISEVRDDGDEVIVLFSVVNTSKQGILLMPPQVQLGGKSYTGKLVKHERWSSAEQLSVTDFRLSRRRLGAGGRADGVVEFDRPPYKQSNEELFLQMADSGAVDRPALAPIGFGVSSVREEDHGTRAGQ